MSTLPFSKAVATKYLYTQQDGTAIFRGDLQVNWSVFGAIHGGYLLSVMTDSLSQWQTGLGAENQVLTSNKPKPYHPDPAHLMTQYMAPAKAGKCDVHVKVTSMGKSWTNLACTLYQPHSPTPLISVLALFTLFPALPSSIPHEPFSTTNQNLLPLTPGPYSRQSPFVTHPAECSTDPSLKHAEEGRRWARDSVLWFTPEHVEWCEDQGVKRRREGTGEFEGKSEKRELEWASWLELKGEGERLEGTIPFWADIFSSIPELFPDGQRVDPHYYPTLAMSLQFHCSMRELRASSAYLCAPKTVGCWGTGSIIQNGRHEQICEVWSAPGPIGRGEVQENWRARTFPIVTSHQIALSIHVSKLVQRQKETKPAAKL